jgi:hypothetical protein
MMKQAFDRLLSEYPIIAQECAARHIAINVSAMVAKADNLFNQQSDADNQIEPIPVLEGQTVMCLSVQDISYAFAVGVLRTWFNETVMKWAYRHSGLPSAVAHAIGQAGEIAMTQYLKSQNIPFHSAPTIVNSKDDFRQDVEINGHSVGLKTVGKSAYLKIVKRRHSYYPAKNMTGESKRVLPYPEYLVQMGVDCSQHEVYILGAARRDNIISSQTLYLYGKPTHQIPISSFKPLKHSSQTGTKR